MQRMRRIRTPERIRMMMVILALVLAFVVSSPANPEFDLFKRAKVSLGDGTVFVHRISCNGKDAAGRRVL